jgi:uncharacterized protein
LQDSAAFVSTRLLSQIWIYPIKSLGGIRLPTARVLEKGLQHDRRWMLIDEQGRFLSQRSYPKMALFKLRIEGSSFVISLGDETIELPQDLQGDGEDRDATIWKDTVLVREAPTRYHRWFSDQLGLPCRLVSFPESNPRPVDPAYRVAQEHVSLADGYPLLIIGQASLDDLNGRLQQPVPMNRFRPNLVFTGGMPYEEDTWRNFTVGKNAFVGVKPCARCVLTTVDQDNGSMGKEPLLTLSKYRRQNDRILFGQNVVPVDVTEVNEGDEIVVE